MIPLFKVHMPQTVLGPLRETLFSGFIGQGKKVDEFERALVPFVGNERVLTVNSGTSALQLALRLANVGYGDEVIVSPMTCSASIMPILAAGADIVWADIDRMTGNISPESVATHLSRNTKAVIAVHWGGYPCDLDELHAVLRDAPGVPLIEDAAHAFGATYQGRKVGSISQYTAFSFQAIKHLTTVDGGLLAVKSDEDYRRGKLIRWYGIDRETPRTDFRCEADIAEYGNKWHMNDVAATIGLEQLKYVDGIIQIHRTNAIYYDTEFGARDIRTVRPLAYNGDRVGSFWLYTVLADDRDGFVRWMNEHGVMCSRVHQRNDIHSYAAKYKVGSRPGVDYFAAHEACIPVGWWVTRDDRARVMATIEAWDKRQ